MTLKGLRAQAGFSLTTAAAELGLSVRQLQRLERGTTPLRRLHILGMAAVYRVEPDAVEAAGREAE